jgi:hypothetical protein
MRLWSYGTRSGLALAYARWRVERGVGEELIVLRECWFVISRLGATATGLLFSGCVRADLGGEVSLLWLL